VITTRHVRNHIQNLIDLLISSKIAITANPAVIVSHDTAMRVTWPMKSTLSSVLIPFGTIKEYMRILEARAYSAVLFDGALLQISYDIVHNRIMGHRLCYYPCPFDIDRDLLLEEPILDIVEAYASSESTDVRLRSPIRFDFSRREGATYASSHVHLLWSHCRCPVFAPLSLGHFVRFVFSNFYPDLWCRHSFLQEWPQEPTRRTISPDQECSLHFTCRDA